MIYLCFFPYHTNFTLISPFCLFFDFVLFLFRTTRRFGMSANALCMALSMTLSAAYLPFLSLCGLWTPHCVPPLVCRLFALFVLEWLMHAPLRTAATPKPANVLKYNHVFSLLLYFYSISLPLITPTRNFKGVLCRRRFQLSLLFIPKRPLANPPYTLCLFSSLILS